MKKSVFHNVFRDRQFNGVFEFDIYRSIENMFSNPTVGVWYDPRDLSSMFQDSLGTTPVTAPGQRVGLRLDKSGRGNHATQATAAARLTYGIEPKTGTRNRLVQTETFDNGAWTKGNFVVTANADISPVGTQTADLLTVSTTAATFALQDAVISGSNATYTLYIKPANIVSASTNFVMQDLNTGVTRAAASVTWATMTASVTPGTGSLVADNYGFYKITLTTTSHVSGNSIRFWINSGGSQDAGHSFYVWGAQLEQSATATPYQKVVTAFEVTEAGIPTCHYCAYAGANSMATAAIDFTATNKMSVFVGVQKLSSGTYQCIVEHGADSSSINGSFGLWANWDAANRYAHNLKGPSAASRYYSQPFVEPITNVVTSLFDLAGADLASAIIPRVNGVIRQDVGSGGAPGGGNFISAPIYFGRRTGSAFPLTGRDYGIIIAGKGASSTEVSSAEQFLANNTPNVTL